MKPSYDDIRPVFRMGASRFRRVNLNLRKRAEVVGPRNNRQNKQTPTMKWLWLRKNA